MNGDAPLGWLMFFTLAAGVIVAAGMFLSFLRSRHNREVAAYALQGNGGSRGVEPSGAAAELGGLLAVALGAMVLLAFGYRSHSGMQISETSGAANNELKTDRTNPDTPKPYQPQNPSPDTRTAPTSSPSGEGANNGGRPEGTPK